MIHDERYLCVQIPCRHGFTCREGIVYIFGAELSSVTLDQSYPIRDAIRCKPSCITYLRGIKLA